MWQVWVPATVLDMAFMADGSLVVLSEAFDDGDPFPPSASVVRGSFPHPLAVPGVSAPPT